MANDSEIRSLRIDAPSRTWTTYQLGHGALREGGVSLIQVGWERAGPALTGRRECGYMAADVHAVTGEGSQPERSGNLRQLT